MDSVPLLIDFAAPSSLVREHDRRSDLPIVGNGPPGTFVRFGNHWKVSLPTDQIVLAEDAAGYARVGFGGMQFIGLVDGQLVFARVREVRPAAELSPARSHVMRLDPARVHAIWVDGRPIWPESAPASEPGRKGGDESGGGARW